MVIALFEHRLRSDIDMAEWEQTFGRMVELASAMPGFISIDGYAGEGGVGLAVVRFEPRKL
jgi:heme-degrading monooxygenase HmoA